MDWDFVPASFQRKPTDDDQCAPAAYVSGDTLFYTGSTYEGLAVWYSTHPKTGRFKRAIEKNVLPSWDPCLFLDDDGRLYLYYGSSNEYPLKAVELDRNDFYPISKIHDVMMLRPEEHGWERFGMNNDDEVTLRPFTEGAYMTKHNDKYYSNMVLRALNSKSMPMAYMFRIPRWARLSTRSITRCATSRAVMCKVPVMEARSAT